MHCRESVSHRDAKQDLLSYSALLLHGEFKLDLANFMFLRVSLFFFYQHLHEVTFSSETWLFFFSQQVQVMHFFLSWNVKRKHLSVMVTDSNTPAGF